MIFLWFVLPAIFLVVTFNKKVSAIEEKSVLIKKKQTPYKYTVDLNKAMIDSVLPTKTENTTPQGNDLESFVKQVIKIYEVQVWIDGVYPQNILEVLGLSWKTFQGNLYEGKDGSFVFVVNDKEILKKIALSTKKLGGRYILKMVQ